MALLRFFRFDLPTPSVISEPPVVASARVLVFGTCTMSVRNVGALRGTSQAGLGTRLTLAVGQGTRQMRCK